MDAISGKVLDEACNLFNDAYSDEALYAAWAAQPGVCAGYDGVALAGAEYGCLVAESGKTPVAGWLA